MQISKCNCKNTTTAKLPFTPLSFGRYTRMFVSVWFSKVEA